MSGKERKFGSMEIAGEITTPSAIRRKRRMRLLKLCGVGVIVATIVILLIVLIVRGNDNSSNSSGKYTIDVYINGVIYAKPPYLESVDSFAVDKQLGRFIAVGAENDVIADVESRFCTDCYNTIDLNEITVLPGLIDAHGHILSLGATLKNIDLYTANSLQMMRDMVEDFITNRSLASEGEWIVGRGWDQTRWGGPEAPFPTADDLDASPLIRKYKVCLDRVDGHAILCNALAMETMTIPEADPKGGEIVRDEKGIPTGVFLDNAENIAYANIDIDLDDESALDVAVKECLSVGLTGVHDASSSERAIEIYKRAADNGILQLRLNVMISSTSCPLNHCPSNNLEECSSDMQCGQRVLDTFASPEWYNDVLRVKSAKFFSDGALGSYGAAMLDPYSDAGVASEKDETKTVDWAGLLTVDHDGYHNAVQSWAEAGAQVCTHAIGDLGNKVSLDTYSKVKDIETRRFRVEHAQIVSQEDIARFGDLGVLPSMQPTHCTSDMRWAEERVGPERIRGAYAWRKMLDAGVQALPLGSDFPVESPNPFLGLYAAVSRKDLNGMPQPDGWYPEEKLTRSEALVGFTVDAAYASFSENEMGSIEPGKYADWIHISDNYFEINEIDIASLKVLKTYVGGKMMFPLSDSQP